MATTQPILGTQVNSPIDLQNLPPGTAVYIVTQPETCCSPKAKLVTSIVFVIISSILFLAAIGTTLSLPYWLCKNFYQNSKTNNILVLLIVSLPVTLLFILTAIPFLIVAAVKLKHKWAIITLAVELGVGVIIWIAAYISCQNTSDCTSD
jgi:hypothetical protein